MTDVQVVDDPQVARAMLDPLRAEILGLLAAPGSATTVANTLGIARQKANYHLRALETAGLISLAEERPKRGLTERVMVATADSYVLSPELVGGMAPDPSRTDRLSTRYLVALGARLVKEVAALARGAEAANQKLATLSIDAEIKFASAADRKRFTEDLTDAVTSLVSRYHHEDAPQGRWHRLVVAAHPLPKTTQDQ